MDIVYKNRINTLMQPHTFNKLKNGLLSAVFTTAVLSQGAFATSEHDEVKEQSNQSASHYSAEEGDIVNNLRIIPFEVTFQIMNGLTLSEAVHLSEVCKSFLEFRDSFYAKAAPVKELILSYTFNSKAPLPFRYYKNLTSLNLDANKTITDACIVNLRKRGVKIIGK